MKELRRLMQKYTNGILILLFALCISSTVFSQTSVYPTAIGVRYHNGFIVQHKQDMDPLVTAHIPAIELFYRYNFSGVKEWEKFYNYPHAGLAIQWLNFRNSKMGQAWSALPYMSFPLRKGKHTEWHFRTSVGIGYLTGKFNLDENRKNIAISTGFNAAIQFNLQAHWHLFREAELLTSVSFSHFSNGAFKEPNAGINIAGINAGLNINLGKPVRVNHNSFPILERKIRWLGTVSGFPKATKPVEGPKFMAWTFSFSGLKRFTGKSSLGGSFDFMYDASLSSRARQTFSEIKTPVRMGITLAYELHVGRITVPIQQGFYLINPIKQDGFVYQRIGIRYHITHRWIAQCLIKAHMTSADYVELGFGYFINR
ncbi:MAG: acyloxyacyl hydrolase [Bacteroidetes bacterium]|nr:acyloxyacyl hydrolase [Bacteroidota bacterium]